MRNERGDTMQARKRPNEGDNSRRLVLAAAAPRGRMDLRQSFLANRLGIRMSETEAGGGGGAALADWPPLGWEPGVCRAAR